MNSRQQQALKTKDKIFRAFIRLLETTDYQKITIRKICNEANVSVGSFYSHYKSKDSILVEVNSLLDQSLSTFKNSDSIHADTGEQIIQFTEVLLRFIQTNSIIIAKYMFSNYLLSEDLSEIYEQSRIELCIEDAIKTGQLKGEFRDDLTSTKIAASIIRFVRGIIYDWLIRDGSYDVEALMREELERFLMIYKSNQKKL